MAIRIAVFASGNGSNFQCIAEYFAEKKDFDIAVLYSNRPDAYALQRAAALGIPAITFNNEQFYNTSGILNDLHSRNIDWIVLAGFLWLVPEDILREFKNRIVNIHPALLPKHGGKGMYGMRVHEAVISSQEAETGITIHLVNERYDEGQVIFQARCSVLPGETAADIAKKIHQLEQKYFPREIEKLITKNNPG
jgi:phosphoribosylglycinamide formyltransferase 1